MRRKSTYVPTPIVYGESKLKSMTVPDQSMPIKEIVRRFVRGIPVDVIQRPGVFIDQSDHDLEQLSRMDFAEKAAMAAQMKRDAEGVVADIEAKKRAKKANEQKASEKAKEASQSETGIGSLDNTMPVDTKQTTK